MRDKCRLPPKPKVKAPPCSLQLPLYGPEYGLYNAPTGEAGGAGVGGGLSCHTKPARRARASRAAAVQRR